MASFATPNSNDLVAAQEQAATYLEAQRKGNDQLPPAPVDVYRKCRSIILFDASLPEGVKLKQLAKMLRKKGYSDVDVETLNSVKVKDQAQGNDTTLYEVSFNEKDAEKKAARQLKAKERMDAIQAAKIQARFEEMDTDGNGMVTKQELARQVTMNGER